MITAIVLWIMVLKVLWASIANSQTQKELFEKDYYLWIQHGCCILTQTQGFQPAQILNYKCVYVLFEFFRKKLKCRWSLRCFFIGKWQVSKCCWSLKCFFVCWIITFADISNVFHFIHLLWVFQRMYVANILLGFSN